MSDRDEPRLHLLADGITAEDVERSIADLRSRGLLEDTGPDNSDGTRSAARWLSAVREDAGLIHLQMEMSLRGEHFDPVSCLAVALKEERRLQGDVYRFAHEIHGLDRQRLDAALRSL